MMHTKRLSIALVLTTVLTTLLAACSGGGGAWDPDNNSGNPSAAPSEPINLSVNAGDQSVSIGWNIPVTNGTDSVTYQVAMTPTSAGADYTIVGTTAFMRGLKNNTTYTFVVTARNGAGTSKGASIQATPVAADTTKYTKLVITNSPLGSGGVADPALLRTASGQTWMAYSNIDTTLSIRPSTVRLAQSSDSGASYRFIKVIGGQLATGGTPAGSWYYRSPWLIEDSSDPDATKRFKLFAHKYLINNSTKNDAIGAIVMWTAAAPDGNWAQEKTVLGWAATDSSLQPPARVNLLHSDLQSCERLDHGSASVNSNGIDMVFSCVSTASLGQSPKIVLMHSNDHAQTFSYVATLLQPIDAGAYSAEFFDMPALLPGAGTAPILIASPIALDESAQGCVVFPIGDLKTGKLFVDEKKSLLALQTLPPLPATLNSGSCAWDRGIPAGGILMGDFDGSSYTIQASGTSL